MFFEVQDVNLSMERLTANRSFTTKLWNAGKFILQNLPECSDTIAWKSLALGKVGQHIQHSLLFTSTLCLEFALTSQVLSLYCGTVL